MDTEKSVKVNFTSYLLILKTLACVFAAEDGKDTSSGDAPETNAQYTTVYVGNLAPEVKKEKASFGDFRDSVVDLTIRHLYLFFYIKLCIFNICWIFQVSQVDLHRHFHSLGAGVIEEVRVQRDKGFGFVRYSTHAEAALAIQMGNTHSYLSGRPMKVTTKCYLIN